MMKILSIDTSTDNLSLALSDAHNVLSYRNVLCQRKIANCIVPEIDKFLAKSRINLTELDGFAVGLGPGSFTSLRVGISAVKAMAFALDKPVIGVSSMDAIAMNVKAKEICVIKDARRGLVYCARYTNTSDGLVLTSSYQLTDIQQVLEKATPQTVFVGDACELYAKEIKKRKSQVADLKHNKAQAKYLAILAAKRFVNNDFDDIHQLAPLYIYSQECQVVGKNGQRTL